MVAAGVVASVAERGWLTAAVVVVGLACTAGFLAWMARKIGSRQ